MQNAHTLWLRGSLAAILLCSPLARADVVADWNTIALNTVTGSGRYRGYEESRVMAMVNIAMSETINYNEGGRPSRLLVTPSAPGGTSSEAAAAAAAHYILVKLHPEQKASLDAALEHSLGQVADKGKRATGRILGMSLGANIYTILASKGMDVFDASSPPPAGKARAPKKRISPGVSQGPTRRYQDEQNALPYYYD